MALYRSESLVKNRLLAYYRKHIGNDMFPIQNVSDEDKQIDIASDEFLINMYKIHQYSKLFITSRRLRLKNETNEFVIEYSNITAVFLFKTYKLSKGLHELQILTNQQQLFIIEFLDMQSLVDARNEIYRVINTALIDWTGAIFKITKLP